MRGLGYIGNFGSSTFGLGLVASGRRAIKSGAEYEKYFDPRHLEGTDPILNENGTNYDTLRLIDEMVPKFAYQTKAIAEKLKGRDLKESAENLWNFLYNHFQYKLDNPKREQIRTPARAWADRRSGIDCDCYTHFAKSVLYNWGVSNASRMASYEQSVLDSLNGLFQLAGFPGLGDPDFQHVYVTIPMNGKKSALDAGDYITLDPVVSKFNYEVPFLEKHDRFMNLYSKGFSGLGCMGGSCDGNYFQPGTPVMSYAAPVQTSESTTTKNLPYELVSVKMLKEDGKYLTEEFLNLNAIPFQIETQSDGGVRLIVTTRSGERISLLPVIGPITAQETIDKFNAAVQTIKASAPKVSPLVWVGLTALGVALLWPSGSKEKNSSLAGVAARPAHKHKRKLKTVRIM
jgi:hypothetical protein